MMYSLIRKLYRHTLYGVCENAWLFIGLTITGLYLIGMAGMLYAEEEQVLNNYTWWFSATITTVGYGDIYPVTTLGRIIAGTVMYSGIGIAGLVIGKLSELIFYFANRKTKGLGYMNKKNHTIIMGYRAGSTEKVIAELLINNPEERIILCSYDQSTNPLKSDKVDFIKGELASDDVLKRSRACDADNFIIHGSDDNQTFFTAYAIREINTSAHMVCYLNNENHSNKIKQLPADASSLNQVILPVNVYLMAQELQDKESSNVVQELISNLSGDNLYRYDIPTDVDFISDFKSVFFAMKTHYQATVLAVKSDQLIINPDLSAAIQSGMALFYAAPSRLNNIDLANLGDTNA